MPLHGHVCGLVFPRRPATSAAWILGLQFGRFYRPKGEQRIAQAFRPGKLTERKST
jgi:hypothetical protein